MTERERGRERKAVDDLRAAHPDIRRFVGFAPCVHAMKRFRQD
jgi:hypothetical protein